MAAKAKHIENKNPICLGCLEVPHLQLSNQAGSLQSSGYYCMWDFCETEHFQIPALQIFQEHQ